MNPSERQLYLSTMERTNSIGKFFWRWVSTYCLLLMITFPISFEILPDITGAIGGALDPLIDWLARGVFGLEENTYTTNLLSDTTGVYVLAFLWLVVSAILALIWQFWLQRKIVLEKWTFWFMQIARYHLIIHLIQFGFNKVFKYQFYFPEPNTLYTTIGNSSRDILFWSTMGSSYEYTVFSGAMELLAALLLLFRRTRLAGALLAMGIMLNVVMINFSFDISVKFLSSFLLLLSVMLVMPDSRRLWDFFFTQNTVEHHKSWEPQFVLNRSLFYGLGKALIIGFIVVDALFPYVEIGNFNDDVGAKPYLHGAYEVEEFSGDSPEWKRAFVHRQGYFIIQSPDESMEDFRMQVDTVIDVISLFHDKKEVATLGFNDQDNQLKLFGRFNGKRVGATLNKIDLKSLPIYSTEFAWTIDTHLKYGK